MERFQCVMCECERATLLGVLGRDTWVRCRACGMDQIAYVEEEEER